MSISDLLLYLENENLNDGFSKSDLVNIEFKTCDPVLLPDWQALPLEHAIPFKSKLNSKRTDLSFETGRQIFKMEKVL